MQNINVVRIKNLHLMENQRPKCTVSFNHNYKRKFRSVQKWNHFALYNAKAWIV